MARRPSSKKKINWNEDEELNLVPIMNLVVCLIPLVLFGASFLEFGVVNVNSPKFGTGISESTDDEPPLNLTVAIGDDGFRITATGQDIMAALGFGEDAPPPTGPLIPKKANQYDFVDLYNKMVVLKTKFPDETIVNLTADPHIHYENIIKVMDSIRLRLEKDRYDDLATFQEAAVRRGEGTGAPELWPDVVLAVAQ